MEELPLVSVVTGYYNRQENLQECVLSILNQTYPNFEYIIFDDCSTDGTYELLKEFDDPRLTVVRTKKNVGFTRGVIQAIKQTKGELIAIHGAGDVSKSHRLATQVDYLLNHPSVGLVSSDRVDLEGTKQKEAINNDQDIVFRKGILYKNYIVHGDVMFRKSVYEAAGGYDPWMTYAQDMDLWVRMRNYCDFHRVPEVLYERGIFTESVSKNLYKLIQQHFFTCLAREREIKGRDFSLLFRDKYQVVADEALTLHFRNKKDRHREWLVKACYQESRNILNRLYVYFHWLPVVNWLLYKLVGRRALRVHNKLTADYRHLKDTQIYQLSVLRKFGV